MTTWFGWFRVQSEPGRSTNPPISLSLHLHSYPIFRHISSVSAQQSPGAGQFCSPPPLARAVTYCWAPYVGFNATE